MTIANPAAGSQLTDLSGMTAEQAVDSLIARSVAMGASDLFLESNEQHVAAEARHLGIMRTIAILDREQGRKAVAYVRNNSGMKMDESRKPDEGRWIWVPEGDDSDDVDNSVDLRLSIIPTLYGDDVAMRLLVRSSTLYKLENLGMFEKQLSKYQQMIASPGGLILITGPTGSGKTATLYATLMRLNDGQRKINTIEDPIEYSVEGLRQSQVHSSIGMGFAELLRAVLRQNPDIIMVGEIRDAETAKTAVRAANSGMLVLATLHSPSTAASVQAMRAYGVPNHFLANSLRGVVAQRLVRTLDPATRKEIDLGGTHAFEEIKDLLKPGEGEKAYAAVSTPDNQMSGYTGQTGVFEVLQVTRNVRNMIASEAGALAIREQAIKDGMLEFRKAALLKVAQGETSTEEVFRVIPTEELLLDE
jgi:type II secretory ATPase GspE/PulE/Tfp pilus assembly ATPase PilB-like protein